MLVVMGAMVKHGLLYAILEYVKVLASQSAVGLRKTMFILWPSQMRDELKSMT